jgi:putative transposase
MNNYKNMPHRRWNSEYHLVWVPKKRMKVVFIGGSLRRYLGNFLHEPAKQKSIVIVEGNLLTGASEEYSFIPRRHASPRVVGYLKGKGTMEISREFERSRRNLSEKNASRKRSSISTFGSGEGFAGKEYFRGRQSGEAYFARSSWV